MKSSRPGVLIIELCGREIGELRRLVVAAVQKANRPDSKCAKQTLACYKNILFKLSGAYRCKHCKSWVF